MQNDDRDDPLAYDEHELRLLARLPREAPVAPGESDRLVARLRQDGYLRPPGQRWRRPALAGAGRLLLAVGVAAGQFVARRESLEAMLTRRDLSAADRILLLQRAGRTDVLREK